MSDVASLDLCKELYELSGWDGAMFYYYLEDRRTIDADLVVGTVNEKFVGVYGTTVGCDECEGEYAPKVHPAYDLGYLLRRLPKEKGNHTGLQLWGPEEISNWGAFWQPGWKKRIIRGIAKTPEDAACKLAIELFKQGVLK